MTLRSAWCLFVLAAAAPMPASGETADLDSGVAHAELEEVPADGPLAVFAAVGEAWRAGDARALTELLDPEDRVGLSFSKGGPRGGWFNRDQAYFLLKDLLEFSRTERFEFETYWNLDSNGRSPFAVAVHEFRMNDGATHTDQVYLSLRLRGETWYVGEIRSIDR
ncbi:MAG: hypothetical protein ACT4PE_02270 [Candidatus Eiseniibacteriota bacterium]